MFVILVVLIIVLFFGGDLLPHMGTWLGGRSRRPVRQAKWMWASFAGSEDESIRAETEYGRECARAFARQFPGSVPSDDQAMIAGVGSRLSRAVNDPRREFHFTLVMSPIANAFALPGGFVFVTKPLLDLCERDRDEIAFFLGHEIGHVVRGHARDQMTAGTVLNAVMAGVSGVGQMLQELMSKGYSRTLELEADREAVRLAAAAGYDSGASLRALQRLARVAPDYRGLAEYFSTHPALSERIRELKR